MLDLWCRDFLSEPTLGKTTDAPSTLDTRPVIISLHSLDTLMRLMGL
jgi:hypothetical protein